jgi:hypothetical protein
VTAGDESYAFTYAVVHRRRTLLAGTIYSPQRWVYVGGSDDIRRSLYRLLDDSPMWMDRLGPCRLL